MRELYKENLKRDLPHILLVVNAEAFATCVSIGQQLMTMHVQYEAEAEYPLHEVWNREVEKNGGIIVSIDGIKPDVGNETIYLVRDAL